MMRIFSHSPGAASLAALRQLARGLQELLLVAPDEEHFEELQLQIAPPGLAADGDADQVRGLVVQAVGHVEVGFGERIALVEVDRRLAADRLIARHVARRGRGAPAAPRRGRSCVPDSSTRNAASGAAGAGAPRTARAEGAARTRTAGRQPRSGSAAAAPATARRPSESSNSDARRERRTHASNESTDGASRQQQRPPVAP